jgi:hypothetical protein
MQQGTHPRKAASGRRFPFYDAMKPTLTLLISLMSTLISASMAAERVAVREAIPVEVDTESGAVVVQITSQPVNSTNVHMEQRFASADGRRIAIERQPFGQPPELWVCDLKTTRLYRIGAGRAMTASFTRSAVYYLTPSPETRLMRVNLADLSTREIMAIPGNAPPRKLAISHDERWLVTGPFLVKDNVFRLDLTELATGKRTTLCELADIPNPHPQFDPGNPSRLLVQVNRGSRFIPGVGFQKLSGPQGATLCLVAVPSGEVTPLPVGLPDTPAISGHSTWAGRSGRVVFTTAPGVHESLLAGTGIFRLTPGEAKCVQIVSGQQFNHLAVSDDGRFFIVDDYRTQTIHIGSIETGRSLKLCDSRTRQGKPQYTHAHPYLTPDNRHVIFNSNVTGVTQVYAATVPDPFLEQLAPLKEKEPDKQP